MKVRPVVAARARPARPWGSIPATMVITAIWWLVAHSSGQGWVQALGELVFGGLVVGVVGPWLVVRRASATIVSSPADATTGQPVELELKRSGPLRVSVAGGAAVSADRVSFTPSRRGVHDKLTVVVATAAPFGLQWWSRRLVVDLPRPLYVAPAAGRARPPSAPAGNDATPGAQVRRAPDGDLRAPRPYLAGDARNTVHWPATAHTGSLMVRDLEARTGPPAEVTVSLPDEPDAAETAAGAALAEVLSLLDAGRPVMLTTDEATGRRAGWVTDPRTARRRMAAAVRTPR